MREFLLFLALFFSAALLSDMIYTWIDFDYNLFEDSFSLAGLLMDYGIFILSALAIYYLFKKIFNLFK